MFSAPSLLRLSLVQFACRLWMFEFDGDGMEWDGMENDYLLYSQTQINGRLRSFQPPLSRIQCTKCRNLARLPEISSCYDLDSVLTGIDSSVKKVSDST